MTYWQTNPGEPLNVGWGLTAAEVAAIHRMNVKLEAARRRHIREWYMAQERRLVAILTKDAPIPASVRWN